MRRYKATGFVTLAEVGEEFEAEFSEAEENELVAKGRIELVPRRYRVTGPRAVFDTPSGGEFERALSLAQESSLMAAGHIEPLDDDPEENLNRLSREELNDRAAAYGVYMPEELPNKQAVIDAIEAVHQEKEG